MYFDNAATTFPKPECVYQKMDEVNRNLGVNAGRGSYKQAREANCIIDRLRNELANMVHLQNVNRVVISPSITVAINQILRGIQWREGDILYISPYEHNAVARTAKILEELYDINVRIIPVNENTLEIDMEQLKYQFANNMPRCVCVNHISNVTGYILPIQDILSISKKYDAITIVDAAQSLGLVDINLNDLDVDFLAFAGHKNLYGPFGMGGFFYNTEYVLKEYITGGTGSDSLNTSMPLGIPYHYESSSPNIVAISGTLEALEWHKKVQDIYLKEKDLTQYIIGELNQISNVKLYLPKDLEKHIGIISFNIIGYTADEVGKILDGDFDIEVRTGYHCAPYIHEYLADEEFLGTVRISLSYFNTKAEVDHLIKSIREIAEEI